ncbi:uncharacterized protein LOC114743028 [Neltuma alba]|uniref:uncharacterized protein LOC114743028 n=1 Tax=Neltuma alba TaxID=207710 RepID=UPI0010A2B93F|nr:uncharacterized protein LOC114743028 [Prosopis alba]
MAREKGSWCWYLVWFTLLRTDAVLSNQFQNKSCSPSRCGIITNISYPFRLRDDPPSCGDLKFELACENNVTLLHLYNGAYRVLGINYENFTIRLVDPGIQEGDCSSLPRYFLSQSNFSSFDDFACIDHPESETIFKHMVYMKCSDPVRDDAAYVDTSPCVSWESREKGEGHVYAVAGDLLGKDWKSGCRVKLVAAISSDWDSLLLRGGAKSYSDIHSVLSYGFEVSWVNWFHHGCEAISCFDYDSCSFHRDAQTFHFWIWCLKMDQL